jgi:DNA-directed RNA polymerase subunit beta'
MRCWDSLLRSARIRPQIAGEQMTLHVMTDDEVLRASYGEVTDTKSLESVTQQPTRAGLFSEQIFGPVQEWHCACGKYRRRKYSGTTCEKCGVELADRYARRRRTGHIELPAPVIHGWFLRGSAGARLAALLRLNKEGLREIADCSRCVVADPGSTPLCLGQVLSLDEWSDVERCHPGSGARVVIGGEAAEILLCRAVGSRPPGVRLEGIVIRRLPVLPPDLRPMTRMADGKVASPDVNELYRTIIARAAKLRALTQLNAHRNIILGMHSGLQKSVEQLLDNARQQEPSYGASRRKIVGLADRLIGRSGSTDPVCDGFLRRPVDYSARTRLVIGETPDLDTALLPSRVAWNLFKPVIINALTETGAARNIKVAAKLVENHAGKALSALEAVCAQALILLSLPSGPWRLVAMHIRPTADLALRVQPELLDQIGWDNLGKSVKLFSILTDQATREAADLLTPSRLQQAGCDGPYDQTVPPSLFDLRQEKLIDGVSQAALSGRPFQLAPADHLLLCDTDWPTG